MDSPLDRAVIEHVLREHDVIKAAEAFVGSARADYDEVKDSDSMSIPAEFMLLVQAVDRLRAARAIVMAASRMNLAGQRFLEAACAFVDKEREEGIGGDLPNSPGVFVALVKAVDDYRIADPPQNKLSL